MTVANVAPVVTLAAGTTRADEGDDQDLHLHGQRPGCRHLHRGRRELRRQRHPGRLDTTTGRAGSFDCTFPDGPATLDGHGARSATPTAPTDTDTQTVTVANVAPTVDPDRSRQRRRGPDQDLQLHRHRPRRRHRSTTVAEDCGANGTQSARHPRHGADSFDCTFPDGPATPTVIGDRRRRRPDQQHRTATPSTSRSPTSSRRIDPDRCGHGRRGRDARPTPSPSPTRAWTPTRSPTGCGANGDQGRRFDTYNAATGLGSFECFFADGPATTNVTVTVTDSDGATDTDNQVVDGHGRQRRPDGDPDGGNDLSANEGQTNDLHLHRHRSGRRHRHRGRATAAPTAPRSARPPPRPRAAASTAPSPTARPRSTVSVQVEDSDGADRNTGHARSVPSPTSRRRSTLTGARHGR